jgi:uroporphyrinogen decarboxylase
VCSLEQYAQFGIPYDLAALEQLSDNAHRYSMLHLHGDQIYFDIAASYPLGMVSWHDQRTSPSLAEAQHLTSKALAGGLDRDILTALTPEEALSLEKRLVDGVERPMLLAPSCVLRPNTPAQTLHALRQAIETWKFLWTKTSQ